MKDKEIKEQCAVCGTEDGELVSVEPTTGEDYVFRICEECLEMGETHYIFVCMACEQSFFADKEMVIRNTKDLELKKQYMIHQDEILIQGIEQCSQCRPDMMGKAYNC